MRTVTIRDAKAHLNELIEAACQGEEVVLMRGSKHVAAIVPLTEDDLELAARLTDAQAGRLWSSLAAETRSGSTLVVASSQAAISRLKEAKPPRGEAPRRRAPR